MVGTMPGFAPAVTATEITSNGSSNNILSEEVSDTNSLPSDENQDQQTEALGLSTEQPSRVSPSGEEVDKNNNPLGPDTVVLNPTYQLAVSMGKNTGDNLTVYDDPIGTSKIDFNKPLTKTSSESSKSFKCTYKETVAVDVDGDGKQGVANIGFSKSDLVLYISEFNNATGTVISSPIYKLESFYIPDMIIRSNKIYNNFTGSQIRATSGDFNHDGSDEIAINVSHITYIYKVTMNSCTLLSKKDYRTNISDINALDTNNDGYPELVVTTQGIDTTASCLYFYDGVKSNGSINLASPSYSLNLAIGNNHFVKASVDIGNLFGDDDKTIVIAGITKEGTYCISYIKYNPDTEKYDTSLPKFYSMQSDSKTSFNAMIDSYVIKCVSLTTPKDGFPEYVVFGGYIFLYNEKTDAFERQLVTTYTEDSSTPRANNADTAESNITNVNKDKDEGIVIDTLVGNFDGNSTGKEQIILLNYNEWYTHNDYVYITQCYMNDKGEIVVNLREMYNSSEGDYQIASICAVDVLNQGTKLKFIPSRSTFAYSDPVIIAILGASPYFEEIEKEYASLGNVSTTYGTSNSSENSNSYGFSVNAGASIGFEEGLGIFGLDFLKASVEYSVMNTFTASWASSTSIEKSVAYTNYYTDDAVVLTVIPYDIYSYEVTTWNSEKNKYETDEMTLQIPYSPITTMMTVEDYNSTVESMSDAPVITKDVLQHTVGDPRTYPSSSKGLSNIPGQDSLTADANDSKSFTGTGVGNNSTEQTITSSSSAEKTYDYVLELSVTQKRSVAGFTSGITLGAGFNTNVVITSTNSTTRSGSVASVPSSFKQYQFNWALVAYNYNLKSKSGNVIQSCPVISYICKPYTSTYPPKVPQNLVMESKDISSVSLSWEASEKATNYIVLRSESEDGKFTAISTVNGNRTNTFTDTSIEKGKDYYYSISANNGTISSIPSDILYVPAVNVKELRIKNQPKLTYKEYDTLNLSSLVITMVMDNGSLLDVKYADFENYNLSTNLQNGIELDSSNNGFSILVTYTPDNLSASTGKLVIKEEGNYPISMNVSFAVGNIEDATYLIPEKELTANISLENTTDSVIPVVVILALYDENGSMVDFTSQTPSLVGNSITELSGSLTLPLKVTGYTAKVFVWEGTSMTTSSLIPLSDSIILPY